MEEEKMFLYNLNRVGRVEEKVYIYIYMYFIERERIPLTGIDT